MREPKASEADEHPSDADDGKLDSLPRGARPAMWPERPVAIAEPIDDDGQRCRDHLRDDRTLMQRLRRQHRRAQQVEHRDIDNESNATHHSESQQLRDEGFHETSA